MPRVRLHGGPILAPGPHRTPTKYPKVLSGISESAAPPYGLLDLSEELLAPPYGMLDPEVSLDPR